MKKSSQIATIPTLEAYKSATTVEANANKITKWLQKAVEKCTEEVSLKPYTYWWNDTLSDFQRWIKCIDCQVHRHGNHHDNAELVAERNHLRKLHKVYIFQCKERAWKEFVNRDRPWGRLYKIMMKTTD
jgi:hypothetical protein